MGSKTTTAISFVVVCFCLLCAVHAASAASFEELRPFLAVQRFNWKEYDEGRRLLKESGELYSAGVVLGMGFDSSLTLKGKAELFGGEVGYDGETQGPNHVPLTTEVTYLGMREEVDLGYRLPLKRLSLEPFAGLGYRWWLRDLQDSTTSSGEPVYGYTETWQTFYGRFGARGKIDIAPALSVFAEGGGKYPFYTGNTVDFVNTGDVTFRPGAKLSAFAGTGVSYRQLKLSVNYEGFRYSRSPMKTVGNQQFFQPKSSSDLLGVSLGWNFR